MGILDTVVTMTANPKNVGGKRAVSSIKYLVYHYTANDGDRAVNNAKYYRDNVVQASAHYFVDDDSIYRSVADDTIAWAVGGKMWTDCAKTGGGRLYGVATNANSLSIEMCDTKRDGTLMATEATLARAAELGRALMEKYNIPIERVIRHFDVNGKHCPAYFMDNGKWEKFKERLKEDESMDVAKLTDEQIEALVNRFTDEQCYTLLLGANRYAATLAKPTDEWAKPYYEAIEDGITDGTRPWATCTRMEAAMMVYRMKKEQEE